jgi:hypothetical protein
MFKNKKKNIKRSRELFQTLTVIDLAPSTTFDNRFKFHSSIIQRRRILVSFGLFFCVLVQVEERFGWEGVSGFLQ